jgi:DNA-3-methyladenine glycosylase
MSKNNSKKLPRGFYTRNDVVGIARELLGKVLYTSVNGEITAGIITETEAYAGISDKASHAYNNRRTARTETMYRDGGTAYVYLCYGIHSLFNVVTSVADHPHAVLIRGIEPIHGIDLMKLRTGKTKFGPHDGIGPGKVARLLGIAVRHSGLDMCDDAAAADSIWIQDEDIQVPEEEIITGPRIGVDYAGEDALLPYRFRWIRKK